MLFFSYISFHFSEKMNNSPAARSRYLSDMPAIAVYDQHIDIDQYLVPQRQCKKANVLGKESFMFLSPSAGAPTASILTNTSSSYTQWNLDRSIHFIKSAYLNFSITNTSVTTPTYSAYTLIPYLLSTGATATASASGFISIGIGNKFTLPLAWNTTAANWQIALRALGTAFAQVTATGVFDATGMVITLTGMTPNMPEYGPVSVTSNSLQSVTPVPLTVTVLNSVAFAWGHTALLAPGPLLLNNIEGWLGAQNIERYNGSDAYIEILTSQYFQDELVTICDGLHIDNTTLQSNGYLLAGQTLTYRIPINNFITSSGLPLGLLNCNPYIRIYFAGGATNILQTLTSGGSTSTVVIGDLSVGNVSLTIGGLVLDPSEMQRKLNWIAAKGKDGLDFRCLLAFSNQLPAIPVTAGNQYIQQISQNMDMSHGYFYRTLNTITAPEQKYAFLNMVSLALTNSGGTPLMSSVQMPDQLIKMIACQKFQSQIFHLLNVYPFSPSETPLLDAEEGTKGGSLRLYQTDSLQYIPNTSDTGVINCLLFGFAVLTIYPNGSVVVERAM